LRCFGGNRRQTSHAVSARPTGPSLVPRRRTGASSHRRPSRRVRCRDRFRCPDRSRSPGRFRFHVRVRRPRRLQAPPVAALAPTVWRRERAAGKTPETPARRCQPCVPSRVPCLCDRALSSGRKAVRPPVGAPPRRARAYPAGTQAVAWATARATDPAADSPCPRWQRAGVPNRWCGWRRDDRALAQPSEQPSACQVNDPQPAATTPRASSRARSAGAMTAELSAIDWPQASCRTVPAWRLRIQRLRSSARRLGRARMFPSCFSPTWSIPRSRDVSAPGEEDLKGSFG
jgi:hypothetical protein